MSFIYPQSSKPQPDPADGHGGGVLLQPGCKGIAMEEMITQVALEVTGNDDRFYLLEAARRLAVTSAKVCEVGVQRAAKGGAPDELDAYTRLRDAYEAEAKRLAERLGKHKPTMRLVTE